MKKILKITAILAAISVVLIITALIVLKFMFPPTKIKALAQQYAQNSLHREIIFSDASFNLIGLTLTDFAISESSTFEQGTFVKADKVIIKIALAPLFRKQIAISTIGLEGLTANIISDENGQFNFADLMSSEEETTSQEATSNGADSAAALAFSLLADHIYAKNFNLYYTDKQQHRNASVTKLNLDIRNFDVEQPFNAAIHFTTDYQDHAGMDVSIPVKILLTIQLANLHLDQAYVTLQNLTTTYKTIEVSLKGGVKNFNQPILNLQGTIAGVSNTALADIMPDLPHFVLPDILFNADAQADLEHSTATLTQAKLSLSDSYITATANVGWGGDTPTYQANTALDLNLNQLASMTNLMDGFAAGGHITGDLTATEKNNFQDIRGKLTLAGLTIQYPPVIISDVNGIITLGSLGNIMSNTITGKLNGEGFTTSFTYKDLGNLLDLVFNFDLSKLKIDSFPTESSSDDASAAASAQTNTATSANEPETLFNLRANVKIGEIEIPYFTSTGATLMANLKKANASMKQANGTVSFTLQEGTIKDLFNFVKDNKVVQILLLPLTLVKKVTSTLGVDIFPAQDAEDKGKIKFQDGSGTYVFTDGIMDLQETHFNSSASNVTAKGNINFKTEALDMRVTATVLTSQTPVVVKIGGTMSDPSGKLDIASTAVSLVGGILNYKTPVKVTESVANTAINTTKSVANTGTQAVKSTVNTAASAVKTIGSLFKKNTSSSEETSSQEAAAANSQP